MYHKKSLKDFSLFAMVDLQLSRSTVRTYRSSLKTFFEAVKDSVTENAIRNFLCNYNQKHPNKSTYSTMLKALRCYFKRYLKLDIVDSFKFPKQPYIPKRVPTKEQLQQFYAARARILFIVLFLAFSKWVLEKVV